MKLADQHFDVYTLATHSDSPDRLAFSSSRLSASLGAHTPSLHDSSSATADSDASLGEGSVGRHASPSSSCAYHLITTATFAFIIYHSFSLSLQT